MWYIFDRPWGSDYTYQYREWCLCQNCVRREKTSGKTSCEQRRHMEVLALDRISFVSITDLRFRKPLSNLRGCRVIGEGWWKLFCFGSPIYSEFFKEQFLGLCYAWCTYMTLLTAQSLETLFFLPMVPTSLSLGNLAICGIRACK